MDATRPDSMGERAVARLPDGIAPMELALALLSHVVEHYDAVVTEVDVKDAWDASFTVRIPALSAGMR